MTMTREEAQAQFERGSAAYREERWQEAADLFGDLFFEPEMLDGTNEMHWNYAMCMAHLDNFPLALEHVRAGGYQETDFWEICRQHNLRDARHDFDAAVELYRAERWQEALDAFAELTLHPGMPADSLDELHWNMGMCYAQLGDWRLAFEHVEAGHHQSEEFRRVTTERGLHPPAEGE